MGSMFKPGQQKTKTSSTASPWSTQTPYLKDAFAQAQNTFRANQTPNANLQAGWNLARDNALGPNSGFSKARDYYKGVIDNGGYDENVWQNISSPVIAGVTSQFMNSGRTGGGLEGINLTNELTRAYAPFAINQVNNAASNLPMLEANAANGLVNAGQQEFQFPWMNLGNYWDIVGGNNWGGTTSGVNSMATPSPFAQIGGYILGNAGKAASMFGGGGGGAGPSPIWNPTNAGGVY